jgi:hypothetical protein
MPTAILDEVAEGCRALPVKFDGRAVPPVRESPSLGRAQAEFSQLQRPTTDDAANVPPKGIVV